MAIGSAIVFFVAAKSWQLLTGAVSGTPDFADSIMSEAAQRFRDELNSLSRAQSTWLGAALVFVVMYSIAILFREPKLFVGYPEWQLWLLLTALGGAALFAIYRLVRTVVSWRRVRLMRDASIAVGHQLQTIASDHGRVYHDVRTSAGVVDHVLIGQAGIYAISVVARRHFGKASVSLDCGELHFSTQAKCVDIVDRTAPVRRLEKDFARLTGRDLRIRSVIAVPGWAIQDQSGNDHLLVNERTLPAIRGWKDQNDYLINEDVDALQAALTKRCRLAGG